MTKHDKYDAREMKYRIICYVYILCYILCAYFM
jgi:hypothetical protein